MSDTANDPFRSLEDASDPATIAWTAEQNARTRAALDRLPGRATLDERFDAALAIGALGVPVVRAGKAFYTLRRGSEEQARLIVRDGNGERVLVDPVDDDPSGLVTLDWWYPSPHGTYVAFGLSRGGDERSTLHVLDVASGLRLREAIPDTRYSSLVWYPDETGFFYTRYPPGTSYDVRAYAHALAAADDGAPIFGEGRLREETIGLTASADGRWLVATVALGWAKTEVYVADTRASRPLHFEPLVEGIDALFDIAATNDRFYVRTDDGAPRFRVFEVEPSRLERTAWREIVAESHATLDAILPTRHALALHYFENVRSVVRLRRPDGSLETLDGGASSLLGWSGSEDDATLYALVASYFIAPHIRAIAVGPRAAGETVAWASVASPIDASRYRCEQHWFVSKDGTRVPMDVLARADVAYDGTAPAVLYGYGGFNVSLLPSFVPTVAPWLDAGGIYAIANLRGGGEFGEAWHRAGTRERKQNAFDDFAAAVVALGTLRIADPARIGIFGGSNGGLLVAVTATQHPELVRAVLCAVPLTDMLRFHLFLIARLWIAEYGDPDDAGDAAVLAAYSPYHHVRDGVAYPAMLVVTAASDSRVDPLHARKFAARVQAATSGNAPVLLYVEPDAGHGAGKPRHLVAQELTDRWSFLAWRLGVTWPTTSQSG